MITYRKAIKADAEILAKIRSIFLMEVSDIKSESERREMEIANKAYFEMALADDSFVAWLAFEDNKIVATSGLSFFMLPPNPKRPDGKEAHIMNMFTLMEYRKKGLGTELFKKIVEEAKIRDYKKITLNATDKGKPIYEKYGFKDVEGDMVLYVE